MANKEINDKELDEYLKGDSDVSSAYRASSTQQPSLSLDEKIISAAKEVVHNDKHESKKHFHKSPLAIPVTIAAMVTLSVSLVVTMQQEAGEPLLSEPEVKMYDSFVTEESLEPEKMESSIDSADIKESMLKHQKANIPTPAALGERGSIYYEDDKSELEKTKMKEDSPKRMLLKENMQDAEVELKSIKKQNVIPSAVNELNDLVESETLLENHNNDLMNIKRMWQDGELLKAKGAFNKFKQNHPNVEIKDIEEVLGLDIYQALIND